MSHIVISDLAHHYPNHPTLFSRISFAVANREKVSVIGNNGAGKSTLLKLIAGVLQPLTGSVACVSKPYYIPQHTGVSGKNIAEVLGVEAKLHALTAITNGSVSQTDYDVLDNDWDIESRCREAIAWWQLPDFPFDTSVDALSGGEKTKVFLAGLLIHQPEIILLDEPTNDLDSRGRNHLYQFVEQSTSAMIIVSHDITLLEQLPVTYKLSRQEMKRYGGNYLFYEAQKTVETNALNDAVHAEEKKLRLARKKAREVHERQEKRASQGAKSNTQIPRIVRNALQGAAENTASKLGKQHAGIISSSRDELAGLRSRLRTARDLKIDFDDTTLHAGKLLIEAHQINFTYKPDQPLWDIPIDFKLYSNDRVRITGNNGSGKTTFLRLLTGNLAPTSGEVRHTPFSWVYLDQHYEQVEVDCSVAQLAESHNLQHLEDHEVKLRLNRVLFPADTWDKNCKTLSGGEKMRLYLCCQMIGNQTPDLIILDEPTNNLDISSLQILVQTIRNYRGSVLVISHDEYFISEIGVTGSITFPPQ